MHVGPSILPGEDRINIPECFSGYICPLWRPGSLSTFLLLRAVEGDEKFMSRGMVDLTERWWGGYSLFTDSLIYVALSEAV